MIYDISQPVFGCKVYPGDPAPQRTMLSRMDDGDGYNLTAFSMCAHNGTHVDAPLHFLKDGKGVGAVALEKFIGPAYVGTVCGDVGDARIDLIGVESQSVGPEDAPAAVHLALLSAQVVLLEGIRLDAVPDGAYMLNCAPLNLGDCDGAPCRAILTDL